MSKTDLQSYAEANAELASAMQAVEKANAAFFKAFKTVEPSLRADKYAAELIGSWDAWNAARKHRDHLRERFRTRYHEAR